LLFLLAPIAACTVGPNYRPPENRLPDRWSGSEGGTATTRPAEVAEWWTLLGDPTLNSLIARAVRSNLDLRIAEARVREARAERAMAASDLWPQVEAVGAHSYQGRSLNRRPGKPGDSAGDQLRDAVMNEAANVVFDDSLDPSGSATDVMGAVLSDTLNRGNTGNARPRAQNLFEIGFDASWEIDVFGGVRRNVEAAEAEAAAVQEGYRDVLVTLLFEVARNYVEARGYQQRIGIAHQNLEVQQETFRLTRSQCDGGIGNELDVAQAQAQLSSTRSQVSLLETSFRHAVHRLSLLIAELPDATLAELSKEAPIPAALPEIPLGLPSDLLRRRPDIRRRERQLAATTARIGVATADLFPKFSLNGSFGSQTYDVRRLLDGRSLAWSVGPGVSWPILDGGRIRANIEARNAIQQEALAQYDLAVLKAVKEVEDALIACQNERVRYRDLADAVTANLRAVSLASARYQEGLSDFLAVVDSERALYTAQEQLVQSRTNTTLQMIAVFKALGGGWEENAEPGGARSR
jgi:NodT family efflux transporter outer membrane factor (OMF) lipoprotein